MLSAVLEATLRGAGRTPSVSLWTGLSAPRYSELDQPRPPRFSSFVAAPAMRVCQVNPRTEGW